MRFLEEAPPRSPYLRDVPFEFAIWAARRWSSFPHVPAYALDLARFELLLFAAGTAERGPRPRVTEPLAADRGVWLDGSVHLARFAHAVSALSDAEGETGSLPAPERRDLALLVYRDADRIELTPPAMTIFELLAGGAPLGRAIEESARAFGRAIDAAWIDGISNLLADLAARGALLGPAPAGGPPPDRATHSRYWHWLVNGGQPTNGG
jgi:hypothetical protein